MLSTFAALLPSLLLSGRLAIVASSAVAEGETPLRYAARDADRVADVLRELGGFSQVWTLHQPRVGELERALDRAEQLVTADPNLELVIFYSGHADDRAVLLGKERLPYLALRERLERSRAAVRVLVLDACQSGGAVRAKGGRSSPGFPVEGSARAPVTGAAILTASSASELALESSDIEGSYFTHHMLSALRGAGDRDGNGLVTLAEAYQYAYTRTVSATAPSVYGPQHPSYEYRLAGVGDLVLTRLGGRQGALSFPPNAAANWFVTTPGNELVAELGPHPARRTRLLLRPGRYRVIRREQQRAQVGEVVVDGRADVRMEDVALVETPLQLAMAKGRGAWFQNELLLDAALSGLGPGTLASGAELGFGWFHRGVRWSFGPHLSLGQAAGNIAGIDYRFRRLTARAYALFRVRLPLSELQLGAGLGVAAIREELLGERHLGLAPSLQGTLALEIPLGDRLALRTTWGLGAELLKLDRRYQLEPDARGALGLVLRF